MYLLVPFEGMVHSRGTVAQVDTLQRLQMREETVRLRGVYEVRRRLATGILRVCVTATLGNPCLLVCDARLDVMSLSAPQDADNVYIVTEMCFGGDLEQLLEVCLAGAHSQDLCFACNVHQGILLHQGISHFAKKGR